MSSRNTPGSGSTNWPLGPAKLGAAKRNFEHASTPSQRLMSTFGPDQPQYGHSSDPVGHETLTSYVNQQVVILPTETPRVIFERPTFINSIFTSVPVAHIQNGEIPYELYPNIIGDRLSSYGLPGSGRHFTITAGFTASMEGLKFDYDSMATDIPSELARIDQEFIRIFNSQELGIFCLAMYQCTASGGAHFEQACIKQDHTYDIDSLFCKANEYFAAFNRNPIKAMNTQLNDAGNIFQVVNRKVAGSVMSAKTDNLLRSNPYYSNFSESGPGAMERSEEPAVARENDEVGVWAGRYKRFVCRDVCIDAPGSVFQPLHNRASFGAHLTTEVRFGKSGGSALSNVHTQEVHVRRPLPGGKSEDHVLGFVDLARKNQHYPSGELNMQSLNSIAKDGLTTLKNRLYGAPQDSVTKSSLLDPYVVGVKREGQGEAFAVASVIGEVEHEFYTDSALAKYVTAATDVVREKLNISSDDLTQCSVALTFLNDNSRVDFSKYPTGPSPMEAFFQAVADVNPHDRNDDSVLPNQYGAPNLPPYREGWRPWGYTTAGASAYFSALSERANPLEGWGEQFRREFEACAVLERVATRMTELLPEIFPGPTSGTNPIFNDSTLHKFQRPVNASHEMLRKLTFIQNTLLPVTLPFAIRHRGAVAFATDASADATFGPDTANVIRAYNEAFFGPQADDLLDVTTRFYVSDATKVNRGKFPPAALSNRLTSGERALIASQVRGISSGSASVDRDLVGAIFLNRIMEPMTQSNLAIGSEDLSKALAKSIEESKGAQAGVLYAQPVAGLLEYVKRAENDVISAASAVGVLRDWIVLPLSISRGSYKTITPRTNVQPVKLTNEKSELLHTNVNELLFTNAQLELIHKMGQEHIGLYGPADMYPELVYQTPGSSKRPPQKLTDYYGYSSGGSFYDKAFQELQMLNSGVGEAADVEPALNTNMARRVSKIASAGDFFTRAVGLSHLGTFIRDTRFVEAAIMAGLPAPIQFLVVCPNAELEFHGHLTFARDAGMMQYTKMWMNHAISLTTKSTVVARWGAGASVNPMLVFYNPYAHLINYKCGKTFRLVDAGRTNQFSQINPSYSRDDPYNIMTAFDHEQTAGDTLVFTWGFGGRPQPKLLALGGPLPTSELRVLHARFSQTFQQQQNQVTPGLLYVNEMTGVMDSVTKKPESFFGSVWDFGTGQSQRVSLYTDAMGSWYVNPVTGDLQEHCGGCGLFEKERELWDSVGC